MERAEFEKTVLPVSRNLYRFAFRLLSNAEDAEDAVQDVCIKLWNMRGRLGEYRNVEALAMTMTRNYCLDMLRRKGRQPFQDNRSEEIRTEETDPHAEAENRESFRLVMKIVNDLPDKYRTVLIMRDVEGQSYEEIVEREGLNLNTVRVNLSRARKMVREKLITLNYEPARTG